MESAGRPAASQRQKHLAIDCTLLYRVVQVIGAVEGVVGAYGKPVGPGEHPFPPRLQETAIAVEYDHRVLAAVEHINPVLGVDAHRRHFNVSPSIGQLTPIFLHLVKEFAAPHCGG